MPLNPAKFVVTAHNRQQRHHKKATEIEKFSFDMLDLLVYRHEKAMLFLLYQEKEAWAI